MFFRTDDRRATEHDRIEQSFGISIDVGGYHFFKAFDINLPAVMTPELAKKHAPAIAEALALEVSKIGTERGFKQGIERWANDMLRAQSGMPG